MARRVTQSDDATPDSKTAEQVELKGPALLTVKQAAKYTKVSEATVRGWVTDHEVAHLRLGRRGGKILFRVEDLDAYLSSRLVEKKEPEPAKAPAAKKIPKSVYRHLKLG